MKFKIKEKNGNKIFEKETQNENEAKIQVFDDFFEIEKVEEKNELTIHNQREYTNTFLGFSKKLTLATDGCFIVCLTFLYNYYNNTDITPIEFNEMMKKENGFSNNKEGEKCLVNSDVASKIIGIRNLGREYTMEKTPESNGFYGATIKEVDFSPAIGKQQHFVIRFYDEETKEKYILDPWGGVKRNVNYYELKNKYYGWKKTTQNNQSCSYRMFVK